MSASTTRSLTAFIGKLPKGDIEPPPAERSAIEELVYAFLLWESSTSRADNALKRLQSAFVDLNDLRVSRPAELHAALGKTYPLLEERVARLQASLHEIYLREYEVSLDAAEALSKRDAKKYLDSLEGMVPFVAARVLLFKLGAHAVPVEQRLVDRLIEAGCLEESADVEKAQGTLERQVKADDAEKTALKLQNLAEHPPKATRKSSSTAATKPAAKTTGKTTKKTRSTKKRSTKAATTKKTTKKTKSKSKSSKAAGS